MYSFCFFFKDLLGLMAGLETMFFWGLLLVLRACIFLIIAGADDWTRDCVCSF